MRKLLFLLALCLALPLHAADDYKQIKWEALVPKGWDPAKDLKALDLGKLQDSDPRAMEALEKMRALWDAAPTEPTLAGAKVKLPGFAIPLENKGGKVSEFLLVPYFGACIHSPPPPANQIIHVVTSKPVSNLHSMDTVMVSGTMSLKYSNTPWGSAGYRLTLERMENFNPAPPPEDKRKR
ncbi:MAG: DUF3299 domain-containing protein [Rhodocyclales bacterium]|nr:DUF3299 domain-containing protein [Rhodocyclales bacterium]